MSENIIRDDLIEYAMAQLRKFRRALTGVEGTRFSDLGQLFACAKFRRALTGIWRLPDNSKRRGARFEASEGFNGRRRHALLRSRTIIRLREVPDGFKGHQ